MPKLGPLPPRGRIVVTRDGAAVLYRIVCGDEYRAMALYDKSVAELANGTFILVLAIDREAGDG